MNLGVRSKLLVSSALAIVVGIAIGDILAVRVIDENVTRRTQEELDIRLRLVERRIAEHATPLDEPATWTTLAHDLGTNARGRVTIVRRDGVVLGDSELDESALEHAENHGSRPEVVDALAHGLGSSTRTSATLKASSSMNTIESRLMLISLASASRFVALSSQLARTAAKWSSRNTISGWLRIASSASSRLLRLFTASITPRLCNLRSSF